MAWKQRSEVTLILVEGEDIKESKEREKRKTFS